MADGGLLEAVEIAQRKSSRPRTCRLPGHEFMRRFLQHVLPGGLHKVRYFGLWHPSRRPLAARARLLLELERVNPPPADNATRHKDTHENAAIAVEPRVCPRCRRGRLLYIRRLIPQQALGQ